LKGKHAGPICEPVMGQPELESPKKTPCERGETFKPNRNSRKTIIQKKDPFCTQTVNMTALKGQTAKTQKKKAKPEREREEALKRKLPVLSHKPKNREKLEKRHPRD